MRVITGTARGRKLATPEGMDTRPTTDMVKESMFSIIQFEVEGAQVLDLFAGSGQLGIEALSRGALHCTFVDTAKEARAVVLRNLSATGLSDKARVADSDYAAFLRSTAEQYDVALLDAPYNQAMLDKALPLLEGHMRPRGVIVCESSLPEALPDTVGSFTRRRDYRYGKIKLTVYRQEEDI